MLSAFIHMSKYPLNLSSTGFRIFLMFFLNLLISDGIEAQNFTSHNFSLVTEVHERIKKYHVEYQEIYPLIKDRFPQKLVQQLDPKSKYLIDKDIDIIYKLAEGFNISETFTRNVLEGLHELFGQRLIETKGLLLKIEQVNFFEQDSILVSGSFDNIHYKREDSTNGRRWIQYLKNQVLQYYQRDSSLLSSTQDQINSKLNERIKFEIDTELCVIESILNSLSKILVDRYIQAFCLSFDPHTSFISAQDESTYMDHLSSESYGTGIAYEQVGNRFYVSDIKPFSTADIISTINAGDEITGVMIGDQIKAPSCIPTNKLWNLFYGHEHRIIQLEIKSRTSARSKLYLLKKNNTRNLSNHVYSFVLKNDRLLVGYVRFPRFYAPISTGDNSSSQDLAVVLLNLKKHGIRDIILDLRNNGGGDIKEAHDLLGYFIDYGPLFSIVTNDNPSGTLYKDTKRGKLVDGKVIYLVNAASASASELVVSAVQKYPNSLVVGSETYGKATGQSIIPITLPYANGSQGIVAVTSIKIFRFDGSNYQSEGVKPDITLPTIINKNMFGESFLDNIIKHQPMRKFRPVTSRDIPLDSLRKLKSKRNSLKRIDSLNNLLKYELLTPHYISLNYNDFKRRTKRLEKFELEQISTDFEIVSLEDDEAYLNESKKIKKNMNENLILSEVFRIFEDWKNLTEND